MKSPIATLVAFTITLFIGSLPNKAHAVNYQQIICDNEPEPETCAKIQAWYAQAKMPTSATYGDYPISCCGVADAYWADEIDKVTDAGVYLTITDKRDCTTVQQYYEDEEGNYSPAQPSPSDDCIKNRVKRDGEKIFVPNARLDDRHQGNPTGHNVVFLGTGSAMYPGAPEKALWPTVYCAFLGFTG